MNYRVLVGLVLLTSVSSIFAEDMKFSLGSAAGIYSNTAITRMDGTFVTSDTWAESTLTGSIISLGVFLDARYAVLGTSVQTRVGNDHLKTVNYYVGTTNTYNSELAAQTPSFDMVSYLYLKYPLDFDKVSIFPAVGIQYLSVLSNSSLANLTSEQKNSFNDFYLSAGGGCDYRITESIYLRGTGMFGYDLMPDTKMGELNAKVFGSSYKATVYRFDFNIGFGFYL